MSVVTTTSPSLSGRDIPNLESLYEAANGVNFTPAGSLARSRSFGASPGRNTFPRIGAMKTPGPVSTPLGA
jgi:hypothetical protein